MTCATVIELVETVITESEGRLDKLQEKTCRSPGSCKKTLIARVTIRRNLPSPCKAGWPASVAAAFGVRGNIDQPLAIRHISLLPQVDIVVLVASLVALALPTGIALAVIAHAQHHRSWCAPSTRATVWSLAVGLWRCRWLWAFGDVTLSPHKEAQRCRTTRLRSEDAAVSLPQMCPSTSIPGL